MHGVIAGALVHPSLAAEVEAGIGKDVLADRGRSDWAGSGIPARVWVLRY